ncbi:flavin reductase family protein [Mycobacteroides abscessus]|uniref:flavin reductase family protein n=1 Tax=Mycobacteroides abscessus TaxID=36809 RepID=UPI001F1C44E5|nr:iron-sulfur cluster-binding domain-containing protein [Mycobacteroides abscessus]
MAFLDELERFGDRVTVRSDDIDGIPLASQIVGDLQNGDALYCCGPSTMIQAATAELSIHPQVQFHYERFGRAPIVGGNVFDIELSRTGQVLRVPANQSVLDIVRQARPNVPYSCQQGFCGTCRTRLLAGEIEHNNHPPAPWHHDDEVLICVSRSSGERLVLDL